MRILNVNNVCYPSETDEKGYVKISAVLVEGIIGDYAVYIGQGSPEFIANRGDKLSFEEALCHFPGLKKENYRR